MGKGERNTGTHPVVRVGHPALVLVNPVVEGVDGGQHQHAAHGALLQGQQGVQERNHLQQQASVREGERRRQSRTASLRGEENKLSDLDEVPCASVHVHVVPSA